MGGSLFVEKLYFPINNLEPLFDKFWASFRDISIVVNDCSNDFFRKSPISLALRRFLGSYDPFS